MVTRLCCLSFGIAGIINAAQVSSKFASDHYDGSLRASQESAKWTKIGFWVGIGVIALYFIFFVLLGVGGFMALSSR